MNLNALRYLVALAREGNFHRAAEAVHVSQPTLSVAIRKLEDELGVALFERRPRTVTLTPAGERILAQAQRVLEEVERLRDLARQDRDQLHGPLRVGAIYTIGPYLFPSLIPELRRRAPEMPLVLEENFTARLNERLRRGEVDAILVSLPFREPGIVTLPLYREPFVVLLPAAHPWREKERIETDALAEEELLLLGEGHCFRDQVLEACPACAERLRPGGLAQTVEGGSLETIRLMVASGLGITVLPCSAAGVDRFGRRLLEVRRFRDPAPARTVALAWRTSFPRPKAIEALRQALLANLPGCLEPLKADS